MEAGECLSIEAKRILPALNIAPRMQAGVAERLSGFGLNSFRMRASGTL